jgi:hypothetical protein
VSSASPVTAAAGDARHVFELLDFGAVILDAGALPHEDVRCRSKDAIAQLLLESGHDRKRDDQRHHADGDAERGDERDDGDEDLTPLGQQVAECDLQFERHQRRPLSSELRTKNAEHGPMIIGSPFFVLRSAF